MRLRGRGFDHKALYVGSVVDKVALWQVSLGAFRLSPAIIIPPGLRTHLPPTLYDLSN
jgi:hypothetical protein